jgi:hypothetical protein
LKGELSVKKFEHLIFIVTFQEIGSSTYVVSVLTVSNQAHFNTVVDLMSSVRIGPILRWHSIHGTVSGASLRVRAIGFVPFYSSETVSVSRVGMNPSPVSIESDAAPFGLATGVSALFPRIGDVVLVLLSADVL